MRQPFQASRLSLLPKFPLQGKCDQKGVSIITFQVICAKYNNINLYPLPLIKTKHSSSPLPIYHLFFFSFSVLAALIFLIPSQALATSPFGFGGGSGTTCVNLRATSASSCTSVHLRTESTSRRSHQRRSMASFFQTAVVQTASGPDVGVDDGAEG